MLWTILIVLAIIALVLFILGRVRGAPGQCHHGDDVGSPSRRGDTVLVRPQELLQRGGVAALVAAGVVSARLDT